VHFGNINLVLDTPGISSYNKMLIKLIDGRYSVTITKFQRWAW